MSGKGNSPHDAPPVLRFPLQSNSLRSVAVRSAWSFEKCGSVAEDPSTRTGALRGFVREAGGCAVDGGLGTELEAHGVDLHDALWSAKCLASAPHLIRIHKVKHHRSPPPRRPLIFTVVSSLG